MVKLQELVTDLPTKIKKAKKDYKFQKTLTKKLDKHSGDFTETTLLEIVLWKTNRYPTITKRLLNDINAFRKNCSEEKARALLKKLLDKDLKGFDLPMASTLLRFACPDKFQIIDQRVYRFITPEHDHLKMLHTAEEKIDLYFKYLKKLKIICTEYNIPFNKADRILYQMDKTENKKIPLSNYGSNKQSII